jgi:2-desacetyl-2-hydroxyethyl bacteriochlorophyllide A dehydrogenase
MKALVRIGKGPREVEIRDAEYPKSKPGWVTIAVKACGICGSDVHMYLSEWPGPLPSDIGANPSFGHEFSGEVVEVGEGVENFVKGDRVACMPKMSCGKCYYCRSGRPFLCEVEPLLTGAMAEYIAAPEYTLFKLPKEITYEEGALIEPFAVSFAAVHRTSHIRPGQTALIIGPGAIGLLTLICAKLASPKLTVITGTREDKFRLQLAKKLGANITIDVTEEDPVKKVKELTDGLGVDVIYECAGAGLLDQAIESLMAEGEFIAIGHPTTRTQIKLNTPGYMKIQFKQLKILGHIIYDWKSFYFALQLLKSGIVNVNPVITHKVPLSDAVQGFELAVRKEAVKVLIIP